MWILGFHLSEVKFLFMLLMVRGCLEVVNNVQISDYCIQNITDMSPQKPDASAKVLFTDKPEVKMGMHLGPIMLYNRFQPVRLSGAGRNRALRGSKHTDVQKRFEGRKYHNKESTITSGGL